MKRSKLIAIICVAFAAGLLLRGCFTSTVHHHTQTTAGTDTSESLWTCSMHPQIRQPGPGKCPICGMDLIPVSIGKEEQLGPRQIALSPAAQAIAQIETAPVERRFVESEVRMVGKIAYDATRAHDVALLADGVIERLFVNYEGVRVRKGDHLAEIYSPEVLAAQKELIAAQRGGNTEGARQKLRLLGVLEEEIDAVLKSGEANRVFTVRSPVDGVLVSRSGNEGSWLNRGDSLATITDNAVVWALLDAYESDLSFIHYGQKVDLSVEALPDRTFTGYVAFIPPELDDMTRSAKIRLNVPNADGALKPGMFVHAKLRVRLSADGQEISPDLAGKWISPMHPEIIKTAPGTCDICGMPLVPAAELGFVAASAVTSTPPLVIPATAPLLTGQRAVVYVAAPDKSGVYEGRDVELGMKAGDFYIVRSGLQEGEQVVVRGNMKIDSAIQLLAKPSMMNPAEAKKAGAPNEVHSESFKSVLGAYFDLSEALATDQLHPAHEAAARVKQFAAEDFPEITTAAAKVGAAESLDEARASFEALSRIVIATSHDYAAQLDKTAYVVFCPMAFDSKGAEWMQQTRDIHNPYFGEEMANCGSLRETIGAGK